ncbi:hypothetical protein SLE2022_397420 [Rubroshorea leprosula]
MHHMKPIFRRNLKMLLRCCVKGSCCGILGPVLIIGNIGSSKCLGKSRRKDSDYSSWQQDNDLEEELPSWDNESGVSSQ